MNGTTKAHWHPTRCDRCVCLVWSAHCVGIGGGDGLESGNGGIGRNHAARKIHSTWRFKVVSHGVLDFVRCSAWAADGRSKVVMFALWDGKRKNDDTAHRTSHGSSLSCQCPTVGTRHIPTVLYHSIPLLHRACWSGHCLAN